MVWSIAVLSVNSASMNWLTAWPIAALFLDKHSLLLCRPWWDCWVDLLCCTRPDYTVCCCTISGQIQRSNAALPGIRQVARSVVMSSMVRPMYDLWRYHSYCATHTQIVQSIAVVGQMAQSVAVSSMVQLLDCAICCSVIYGQIDGIICSISLWQIMRSMTVPFVVR